MPYLKLSLIIGAVLLIGTVWFHRHFSADVKHDREIFLKEEQARIDMKASQLEMTFRQIYQGGRTIALLPSIRKITGRNLPKGFPAKRDVTRFSEDAQMTVQQIYNNLASNVRVSEVYYVLKGFRPDLGETPFFMYDSLIVQKGARGESKHDHRTDNNADYPEEYEDAEYSYYVKQLETFQRRFPRFAADFNESIDRIPMLGSPAMRTCDNTQYLSKTRGDVKNTDGLLFSVPVFGDAGAQDLIGLISVIIRANVFEALLMDRPFVVVTEQDRERMEKKGWRMPEKPAAFVLRNAEMGVSIFDRRNPTLASQVESRSSGESSGLVLSKNLDTPADTTWELRYLTDESILASRAAHLRKMFLIKLIAFYSLAAIFGLIMKRLHERRQVQDALKHDLEEKEAMNQRLRENQAELEQANDRLAEEIAERVQTQRTLKEKMASFAEANEELVQMQNQLQQSMARMEETMAELEEAHAQLKENQGQLIQSEKMASLGQLAAGVAHEINNPVGFIRSNLGTLTDYVRTFKELLDLNESLIAAVQAGDEAQLRANSKKVEEVRSREDLPFILGDVDHLLKESLDGADRVKDIVQNLKSFARLDEAQIKETNINDCVESTLKIIWNELKYKCQVHKKLGTLPMIRCYPGQLNQVFVNLLVNAAQAIPEKGDITIQTEAVGPDILIRISDTGKGIPPENMPKLFTPFFTTKPTGKGTGLGLSISYGIVKKHNGDIQVESQVGKGTTFTIRLPREGVPEPDKAAWDDNPVAPNP